jgi:hypothetical protein
MATGFVDLASLPFTMTGLLEPEQAVGSTAYLTSKGLLPPSQEGLLSETSEMLASAMSPAGAAKTGLLGLGAIAGKSLNKLPDSLLSMTRDEFIGNPKIVSPKGAKDLKPTLLTTNENIDPVPFMGKKYQMKMSEDGASVLHDGKVIASYNFGDTLVVDPKYRNQGIGEELVYQFRTVFPDKAKATTRTKKSQAIQEKVWDRIEREKYKF